MRPLKMDLSIYNLLELKRPPVGVKFLYGRPEDMKQIDKQLPFCEMFKEAQQREEPFYFGKENEDCVGKLVLGMQEYPDFVEAGELGPGFGVYQDARANKKLYQYIPKFDKNTVNYVAFAKLDKLTFDPDLLILMGTPSQAEIILRAYSYSSGVPWEPKATSVLGCGWIYVHPFLSGKVNYTVTGLAFGMKAKHIFEEGQMIISIPFNWIPTITENLKEMTWALPAYTEGREAFAKREAGLFEDLAKKYGIQ